MSVVVSLFDQDPVPMEGTPVYITPIAVSYMMYLTSAHMFFRVVIKVGLN